MKDELYPLQQVLFFEQQAGAPAKPRTGTPLEHIAAVALEIRNTLANGVLSCTRNKHAIAYLRHHQMTIIGFQDLLVTAIPENEWYTLHGHDDTPATSWTAHAYHQLDE